MDALAAIEADTFATDRLSRRSLQRLLRSPSATFLVACRGREPLGYALVLFRRGSRIARLYSIAVAGPAAGRGVGSRLLEAAENAARRRGMAKLRLEVRADNRDAIRFYRSRLYRETGRRADYYEDGMSALLFVRLLAPQGRAVIRDPGRLPPPRRRLPRAA